MTVICSSSGLSARSTLPITAPMFGVSRVMVGLPRMLSSPDVDAILGSDVEPVAGPDAKGSVPCVDVADDSIDTVLPRRVRVAHHLFAHESVTELAAPGLRPAEEDTLITGDAVDHRRRLALERAMIG